MAIPKDIEPTEGPLDLKGLKILIEDNGYKVDMLLQYQLQESKATKKGKTEIPTKGAFLIFAKYHQPQIIRQVITQRNQPRKFKNLDRALSWGKFVGFRTAQLAINLDDYIAFKTVGE